MQDSKVNRMFFIVITCVIMVIVHHRDGAEVEGLIPMVQQFSTPVFYRFLLRAR